MLSLDSPPLMYRDRGRNQIRMLILGTVVTVGSLLYWEGRIAHLLFWDEGFLWYGAQRVVLGEVPLRDFMSADPGRYYWSAAIMALVGENGVIALRLAAALFQSIGLFFGLWVVIPAGGRTSALYIMLAAVTLALWMYPHYKVFDITVSILLIAAFAFLLDQPSLGHHFFAGLVLGLAACVGRNHGLYGVIGGISVIVYLQLLKRLISWRLSIAYWLGGIAVGYLPLVTMIIFIPDFGNAFWESVRYHFEHKSTNLPLPIPWPWLVDINQPWSDIIRNSLIGLFFLFILLYGVLGLAIVGRSILKGKPLQPNLAASALLALPYTHYAYSRADIYHLALGVFPLLIGLLGFGLSSSTFIKRAAIFALVVLTLFTILPFHPGWLAYRSGNWPTIKIGDNVMIVDPGTAGAMKSVAELVESYAPNRREFLVTPFWPGAYAAFRRKSPMWDNYALFPRNDDFQRAEIERIKKADPGFVLVFDYRLDGRDEYLFQNSHPLIDRFIRDNFIAVIATDQTHQFRTYIAMKRDMK
jgi:hypothetical protein